MQRLLQELSTFILISFLSFHATCVVASQVVILQEWQGSSLTNFPLTSYSHLNVYNYTLSHGYDYKLVDMDRADMEMDLNLTKSWMKVFALRELMRSGYYDYVVFIGSDFFIQSPEKPLIEVVQRWRGFSDVYIAKDVDVVSRLNFTTIDGNVEEIDGSWNGGLQIWKNTMKNWDLLESWMVSTKKQIQHRVWKTQFPYEMGSFVKDILPLIQEEDLFYHVIELRKGMDSEGFIAKLDQSNLVQYEGPIVDSSTGKLSWKDGDLNFSNFFVNISNPLKEYRLSPERYILVHYVMKDIDNEDFDFSMNLNFESDSLNENGYQFLANHLLSYCEYNRINTTECTKMVNYTENLQREKAEDLKKHLIFHSFMNQNPNFFQERQPALQPRKDMMNAFPRTIVTIFAGRKDRLAVLMKYLNLALSLNIIQEVHLWDYCRKEEDRIALKAHVNPKKSIFIRTKFSQRPDWYDYYEYYDLRRLSYPNDIIIKCDDDVVFIDVFKLPYFLSRVREENELLDGVLFANIINNGVAAHYQQTLWNLLPKDVLGEFEYPEGGFCGTLWSSGETANKLHEYFLSHWEEIIRPNGTFPSITETFGNTRKHAVYYEPEFIPILTRFSINFFAIQAKNWYKIKDIGVDDEYHLTKTLTKYGVLKNYLSTNFFVSHLSFSRQNVSFNATKLLNMYDTLYEDYVMKNNLYKLVD